MERQIHGFLYQEDVIQRFNIKPSSSYTAKWDGEIKGVPVSIKCIQDKSAICLGDFFRQSKIKQDFYLIVGFWSKDKSNIIAEHMLYIPHKYWMSIFSKDIESDIQNLLITITNDHSDDIRWSNETKKIKQKWKNLTGGFITLNGKRDHKKQKRYQCSINYSNFQLLRKQYEVPLNEL